MEWKPGRVPKRLQDTGTLSVPSSRQRMNERGIGTSCFPFSMRFKAAGVLNSAQIKNKRTNQQEHTVFALIACEQLTSIHLST
jgi:hypothetical protein